jgi:hypothetical protein
MIVDSSRNLDIVHELDVNDVEIYIPRGGLSSNSSMYNISPEGCVCDKTGCYNHGVYKHPETYYFEVFSGKGCLNGTGR